MPSTLMKIFGAVAFIVAAVVGYNHSDSLWSGAKMLWTSATKVVSPTGETVPMVADATADVVAKPAIPPDAKQPPVREVPYLTPEREAEAPETSIGVEPERDDKGDFVRDEKTHDQVSEKGNLGVIPQEEETPPEETVVEPVGDDSSPQATADTEEEEAPPIPLPPVPAEKVKPLVPKPTQKPKRKPVTRTIEVRLADFGCNSAGFNRAVAGWSRNAVLDVGILLQSSMNSGVYAREYKAEDTDKDGIEWVYVLVFKPGCTRFDSQTRVVESGPVFRPRAQDSKKRSRTGKVPGECDCRRQRTKFVDRNPQGNSR